MAGNSSAMKHHRQSEQKRLVNRSRKSAIRTFTKKALAAAESGDSAAVKYQRVAVSLIDQAAAGSTLHKRTAARKKSRLAKRLNKAAAAQA